MIQIMMEEGMEAVFREGMNAVLKKQGKNVINESKKKQKEEEPSSSGSVNKGEGEQHPIRTFSQRRRRIERNTRPSFQNDFYHS